MFKNLKRNLILINMTIITSVMILAFGSIFLVVRYNTMTSLKEELSNLSFNRAPGTYYDDYSFEGILPSDYQVSFQLVLNPYNDLVSIRSYIDMPINLYQEALNTVINQKKDEGKLSLNNKTWLYEVNVSQNYVISYLDITESMNNLNRLGFAFIGVGLVTLGIIYLISVYFANKSLETVEESWIRQKDFISNASHELKTPLSVLRVNVDALNIEEDNQWLNNIKNEITNMDTLITDLLDLSKSENQIANIESINLSELVTKIITSFEVKIYEANKTLSSNIEDNLLVKSDKIKLSQIITILLDNALKYSDKEIKIKVYKENKKTIFEIENDGESLSPNELAQVFERFYKKDSARSKYETSYGLGLPIAKNLSEVLNHKLEIESKDNHTKVKITL